MIVVDTSALIAILREETDSAELAAALGKAGRRLISAGTMLEAGLVTVHRADEHARLMQLVERAQLEVVAIGAAEVESGIQASRRFGPWQQAPRQAQFRRLLRLCAGQDPEPAAAFQGRRFHSYRHRTGTDAGMTVRA